jgi:hypothetical protein
LHTSSTGLAAVGPLWSFAWRRRRVAVEVVGCCSVFTFAVAFMRSTCMCLRWSPSHGGSRVCLFHRLSPGPTLCFRTLGDRGGLACAECFGLGPSAGEVGLPIAAPLLVDYAHTWWPFSGRCCGVSRHVRGSLWVSLAVATLDPRASRLLCHLVMFLFGSGHFLGGWLFRFFHLGLRFCVGSRPARCNSLLTKKIYI